ncbi:hypothetical protein BD413DRAFT_617468 [Trametes elegans]|nr:hypothetical protein BD413DRAFT_617468 [Trametes elegans]
MPPNKPKSYADALSTRLSNNVDYSDDKFHRNVFTHIKDKITPTASVESCPPLPVIVYAIRNILEPEPVLALLPQLLRLLAHLESVRAHTVVRIEEVLRLNQQLSAQDNADARPLDTDAREALQALTKPSRLAAQRTVYRKVVHGCCLLHIHHLWRTYDPGRDPPLTAALLGYFPAFLAQDPDNHADCVRALAQHPWHHAATPDELAENRRVGAQAAEFMLNAAQYTEAPREYCDERGYDADAPFDVLFPPPDVRSIAGAIMRFVDMVRLPTDTLQSIFQDSSS